MSDDELDSLDDATGPGAASAVPDDAAPVSGRSRRENRIERELREAEAFWRGVLADKIGRRELWRMVAGSQAGHAFETRFPKGPTGFPDENEAWYARGEQDLALRLYHHWLRLDHAAVALMHHENDPRFAKPKRPRRREPS